MGHQIEYYSTKVTTEKNLKLFISRITGNAYDPRESGGYHGNLTIHRNEIYKNYEEAVEAIKKYDSGWYSDHIVMYYDISAKGRAKVTEWKRKEMILLRLILSIGVLLLILAVQSVVANFILVI